MTADPRAELLRDFSIKLAILRQRTPWVLRDILHRDGLKQEYAQKALLEALASCVDRYDIERAKEANETRPHSTP